MRISAEQIDQWVFADAHSGGTLYRGRRRAHRRRLTFLAELYAATRIFDGTPPRAVSYTLVVIVTDISWRQRYDDELHPQRQLAVRCHELSPQSCSLQTSASSPLRSTRFSSFSDGPLGCLSPRSHFCTVDGLVFR